MRAFAVLVLAPVIAAAGMPGAVAAPMPAAPPAHAAKKPPAVTPPPPHPPAAKAALPADPLPPAPLPLAAAIPPGALRDHLRRLLLKPYADATGTELVDAAWEPASADPAKPPTGAMPDLVLVSGAQLTAGCRAQALAKLDWNALGRDNYLPLAVTECGAGAYVAATALAWDRDKLQTVPTWPDFWDVARHPGGRGLRRVARGNLEIALLADGVAPGDIYRTLRSSDGIDRAFRKLDQLKPYIIWWDQPEQPAQMLAAGRVLLTSAPASSLLQTAETTHRAFGLQWAGSLTELHYWAVPQAAPNPAVATAALLIAGDIARQALFARATGLGPVAPAAVALLPATVRAASPAAPANLQGGLAVDEAFWLDNEDKLQARFIAWAAK